MQTIAVTIAFNIYHFGWHFIEIRALSKYIRFNYLYYTLEIPFMLKYKILLLVSAFFLAHEITSAQAISSNPETPTRNEQVVLTVDITKSSNKSLLNYTGDVYVHIGVLTASSKTNKDWKHLVTKWGNNSSTNKASKVGENKYSFTIAPDIKTFFSLGDTEQVSDIAIVFRSGDGAKQTEDLFAKVYEAGLNIQWLSPQKDTLVEKGKTVAINAKTLSLGTTVPDSVNLYINSELKHVSRSDTIWHYIEIDALKTYTITVEARNTNYRTIDSIKITGISPIISANFADSLKDGINYLNDTSVALILFAPNKTVVHLIGDFNNWEMSDDFVMTKSVDGNYWWTILDTLKKRKEYAFQYLIDGETRITDPYVEKVLDPINDKYIPTSTYPNLKAYPEGKTTGIVGVLQTGQGEYNWKYTTFNKPAPEDLVIYELHVQNFTEGATINALIDTIGYLVNLGVNAIELMPVNEFEGNVSWGYNPSFYFAFDKTYGTRNDFKKFVDTCHSHGIAVIMDLVLNHSYSQSPLVQMYWDGANVTEENPWYNKTCPHATFCWGYDFDHESKATQYFIDRVNSYWIENYKVDGYRFDFTKGFTNTEDKDAWGPDASRITILKRMSDKIWEADSNAYIIFEHLTENSEEKQLAEYGVMLWGNMNHAYNEATMGYNSPGKSDISGISYKQRDWRKPHLVGYMESHDEERLVYKQKKYGNSNSGYSTKEHFAALKRVEAAAAFFLTVPGPKMIWEFGELGYDYSINTCKDGSVNGNCRLDLKPVKWEYYNAAERFRLHQIFKMLIAFKTQYGITKTSDFTLDVGGALKKIHLNSDTLNVTILGNFDIVPLEITPNFQHTGTWYSYLTGSKLEVASTKAAIKLEPGGYFIYTDKKLEVQEYPSNIENSDCPILSAKLYPNPVLLGGEISVQMNDRSNTMWVFSIYNAIGKNLYQQSITAYQGDRYSLSTSEIPGLKEGVYYYQIKSQHQKIVGKLIVE